MSAPVNLDAVKWLKLCDQAELAARLLLPNPAADNLAVAAGRLSEVSPPIAATPGRILATSLRWDCTAFGLALPDVRALLADALVVKAKLVRDLLEGRTPEPGAVAKPVPGAVTMVEELPRWAGRADIGG